MSPATISAEELAGRLGARDATLWPDGNVSSHRLGWLDAPREMEREARELERWAAGIDQDTIVLLGMGGSSLGTAVLGSIRDAFGAPKGRKVVVCDTTDPTTITAAPIEDAFVIVASKSGTTLEPNALFAHARGRLKDLKRYAIITDPRTPLASEAEEIGVNRIFTNRPDLGGRYSVLSHFGLVPAALAGYDIDELCGRALEVDRLAAVQMGIDMASAALDGRDKTTIVGEPAHKDFGLWAEQLLAESTGKLGRGCVPVPTTEEENGRDRHLLHVRLGSAHELGAEFFRFELAMAAAGNILGLDPFDEPNVAESTTNTERVLNDLPLPALGSTEPEDVASWLADEIRPGDYVSIQAYLPYGSEASLEALRRSIRDHHSGMAVTAGYGPRFLRSTGQLHKGGPSSVLALQLVRRSAQPEVPIPGKPYDFGTLIAAQAIGDYESLVSHGRRVLQVAVDDPAELL